MSSSPLLTICVPTLSRPHLLRVMLEALLPQAAVAGEHVEVWVLNNAADQGTAAVVDAARAKWSFRYLPSPLLSSSPLGSGYRAMCEACSGEFVWQLGDHNLVTPGAVSRVLNVLSSHSHLDAVYTNFRCAKYPEQWPSQAHGGFDGPYHYLANPELHDRAVSRWESLIRPESALCTQMYAHICRRQMWVDHFQGRSLGQPYTSLETTFMHTSMIARTMFGRESYYIGTPSITIFNGAQSWNDLPSRAAVDLMAVPELITLYKRLGWPAAERRSAEAWAAAQAERTIQDVLRAGAEPDRRLLRDYLLRNWRTKGCLGSVWRAFLASRCCRASIWASECGRRAREARQYAFHDCRPARWMRGSRFR